jgi:hypothetical protein
MDDKDNIYFTLEVIEDNLAQDHPVSNLTERWVRTHERVCPITGRVVTLRDVEEGRYHLSRINGDSRYGYCVFPSKLWAKELVHRATLYA